ncbi:MAG TPA: carbohydrate porin, partial [Verrucomicrobiae bacterium]
MMFCIAATAQETNAISNTPKEIKAADSIWTRPALGGSWGGLRPMLDNHGVSFKVELTQFGSGMTSGQGPKEWQYGGKGDFYLKVDGAKAGLWEGLFIDVRGEQNYGRDINGFGETLIPNNAALAFPGERGGDIGLEITQKFTDQLALKFGKLSMVDAAKATPIKGGGGIDTFMNTALAVPPSGLIPPEIFGVFLNFNTKAVSYAVAVYDPLSAAERTGFEHPFRDGVSFRASATLKAKPFGLAGFYGIKAMYSTMHAFDLRSIPDLIFPPEDNGVLPTRSNPYYVGVSVQQYFYQDPDDPKRGWGFFGEFGRSDGNPTRQQWAGYFGFAGVGPIPGRSDDRCGIGFFRNSLSDYLVTGLRPLLQLRDEQGLEAFYNAAVTPWL